MLTANAKQKNNPDEFIPIRSIVFSIFAYSFNVCNKIYSFTSEIERWTKKKKKRAVLDGDTFFPFIYYYFFLFCSEYNEISQWIYVRGSGLTAMHKKKKNTTTTGWKIRWFEKCPKIYFIVLRWNIVGVVSNA